MPSRLHSRSSWPWQRTPRVAVGAALLSAHACAPDRYSSLRRCSYRVAWVSGISRSLIVTSTAPAIAGVLGIGPTGPRSPLALVLAPTSQPSSLRSTTSMLTLPPEGTALKVTSIGSVRPDSTTPVILCATFRGLVVGEPYLVAARPSREAEVVGIVQDRHPRRHLQGDRVGE